MNAQPTPPSAIAPAVRSDLERVILRCLRKDPDRRFQHMIDVKVELQDIKDESDGTVARAKKVARPAAAPIRLLAGLAVVTALTFAARLMRPRPAATLPPSLAP